jgi:folate-binding protein YgfZ
VGAARRCRGARCRPLALRAAQPGARRGRRRLAGVRTRRGRHPSRVRWGARTDGYALRLPGAHARGIALAPGHATVDAPAFDAWQRANIADRLPWIGPASTGRYVPQAMELERIGAIRFDKGCYPGQEIAARLHFRGGNKRGLRVVEAGEGHVEDGAGLIDASGALAGHVLYGVAAENGRPAEALAVVNLDAGAVRPAPSPLQGDPEARPDLAGFGYLVESPSKLRLTLA